MNKLKCLLLSIILLILLITNNWGNTVLLFHDFNNGEVHMNKLGGVCSSFNSAGSSCRLLLENDPNLVYGRYGYSLRIDYDVPVADTFCGYWTKVDNYDFSAYNYLSFWVKGTTGSELLKVEIKVNDPSDPDREVSTVFVPNYMNGGMSTSWKKVVIPLDAFYNINNWTQVLGINFVFENGNSMLNNSPVEGTVYIDNIIFGTKFLGCLSIDSFGDLLTPCATGGNTGTGTGSDGTLDTVIISDIYSSSPNALKLDYNCTPSGSYSYYYSVCGVNDIDHNLNQYNKFAFKVKAKSTNENPQGLKIEVQDTIDYSPVEPNYKILTNDTMHIETNWQTFKIILTNFKDANLNQVEPSQIFQIVFTFENNNVKDKAGTIYIDDVQFESAGYTNSPVPPIIPFGLKDNTKSISDGYTLTRLSKLFVNAGYAGNDTLLECIRWEFSRDNQNWMVYKTDYDLSDNFFQLDLDLDNFSEENTYYLRVVSQNVYGTASVLGPYKSVKISKTGYSEERLDKLIRKIEIINNPFSPDNDNDADTAVFEYTLAKTADVKLQIFDVKGHLIWEKEESQKAPTVANFIEWNGRDINNNLVLSGVYFFKIYAKSSDEDDHIIQVIGVIK